MSPASKAGLFNTTFSQADLAEPEDDEIRLEAFADPTSAVEPEAIGLSHC